MGTTVQVSRRYQSSFLSLRYERYAKQGKADMFVKLGGYGSNRENASKAFKIFIKVMPIIAESQFPWSKNSISMPFDT